MEVAAFYTLPTRTAAQGILVNLLAILRWKGTAEEEKGVDKATGKVRVEVDPKYYRPTEVVSVLQAHSQASSVAVWNV